MRSGLCTTPTDQGLLTLKVWKSHIVNNRSFFSEKLFAWAIAMLRAEERVLKGEEWSSEKEAAWAKNFFFIQV